MQWHFGNFHCSSWVADVGKITQNTVLFLIKRTPEQKNEKIWIRFFVSKLYHMFKSYDQLWRNLKFFSKILSPKKCTEKLPDIIFLTLIISSNIRLLQSLFKNYYLENSVLQQNEKKLLYPILIQLNRIFDTWKPWIFDNGNSFQQTSIIMPSGDWWQT